MSTFERVQHARKVKTFQIVIKEHDPLMFRGLCQGMTKSTCLYSIKHPIAFHASMMAIVENFQNSELLFTANIATQIGWNLTKRTRLSRVARISGGMLGEEKAFTRLLTNCSWCWVFSCDQQLTKPAVNNSRATKGCTQPEHVMRNEGSNQNFTIKIDQVVSV